jgi:hypothetical protein
VEAVREARFDEPFARAEFDAWTTACLEPLAWVDSHDLFITCCPTFPLARVPSDRTGGGRASCPINDGLGWVGTTLTDCDTSVLGFWAAAAAFVKFHELVLMPGAFEGDAAEKRFKFRYCWN